jgi:hypothetical protein
MIPKPTGMSLYDRNYLFKQSFSVLISPTWIYSAIKVPYPIIEIIETMFNIVKNLNQVLPFLIKMLAFVV